MDIHSVHVKYRFSFLLSTVRKKKHFENIHDDAISSLNANKKHKQAKKKTDILRSCTHAQSCPFKDICSYPHACTSYTYVYICRYIYIYM